MRIERVPRWVWILLSLPLGFLLGWIMSGMEPVSERLVDLPQHRFEEYVRRTVGKNQVPVIRDLKVYPPQKGYSATKAPGDRQKDIYVVTGLYLDPSQGGEKRQYKPFRFNAETPFRPRMGEARQWPGDNRRYSVMDYLIEVGKTTPHVKFSYAWTWDTRPLREIRPGRYPLVIGWLPPLYALWMGGTFVVIGLFWPTVVNLLAFGSPFRPKSKDEFDLGRYRPAPVAPKPAPSAPTVTLTPEEEARMKELEASVTEFLERGKPAAAGAGAGAGPVKKLDGGPLQPSETPARPGDPVEYTGEYYPVARSKKKPGEEEETP